MPPAGRAALGAGRPWAREEVLKVGFIANGPFGTEAAGAIRDALNHLGRWRGEFRLIHMAEPPASFSPFQAVTATDRPRFQRPVARGSGRCSQVRADSPKVSIWWSLGDSNP
jgi:hypothetical protein